MATENRSGIAPIVFALREYRALRRRSNRRELDHLRTHAAGATEQLDTEHRAREQAEDAADFWREQALNVELRDDERLGVTGK